MCGDSVADQPSLTESERFTPTCVGTAPTSPMPGRATAVHPHMCGDSSRIGRWAKWPRGSPPHVWGQQVTAGLGFVRARFTPTCVGTAWASFVWILSRMVHPHMCGDSGSIGTRMLLYDGSHPTCVGTARGHLGGSSRQCSHPTCVGTAAISASGVFPATFTPHMCGDSELSHSDMLKRFVHTPHVWGQRGGGVYRIR